MEVKDKLVVLQEQVIRNNTKLLQLLNSMNPEDKKIFAPKVQAIINKPPIRL